MKNRTCFIPHNLADEIATTEVVMKLQIHSSIFYDFVLPWRS